MKQQFGFPIRTTFNPEFQKFSARAFWVGNYQMVIMIWILQGKSLFIVALNAWFFLQYQILNAKNCIKAFLENFF